MDEVGTNQNQSTTMRRVQTTLDDGNKMQVSLKKQDVWGLCAYDFKTMCHILTSYFSQMKILEKTHNPNDSL